MSQQSLLKRLKALESTMKESLSEVQALIEEVRSDNVQSRAPRQKHTNSLPGVGQVYAVDLDFNKLTDIFQVSEEQARYYLHHVIPPGGVSGVDYKLEWVCNVEGKEPYIFTVMVPPAEMYNQRINTLIEAKYPITSARFLKSILNNAIEGLLNYRYYNFKGMKYFSINVTNTHPSLKAKPVTYWFDIKSLDTLDVVHKQNLQHHRGFDFIETFRL